MNINENNAPENHQANKPLEEPPAPPENAGIRTQNASLQSPGSKKHATKEEIEARFNLRRDTLNKACNTHRNHKGFKKVRNI